MKHKQNGWTMIGKIVGAGGNTLAGIMAGYGLHGPIGAVVGGIVGLGVWGLTETKTLPYAPVCMVLGKATGRLVATKVATMAAKKFGNKAIGVACKKAAVHGQASNHLASHIAKMPAVTVAKRALQAGNIIGIVADVAQVGLELAGYEKAGKAVGLSGNVASGALTGFALAGPAGAAVGAVLGAGLWAGAEWIGSFF